jgi:hypothetical protein
VIAHPIQEVRPRTTDIPFDADAIEVVAGRTC